MRMSVSMSLDRVTIGIVSAGSESEGRLAGAVRRNPNVQAIDINPSVSTEKVAGLVVDAPLAERGAIAADVVGRWSVPLLVEAPLAAGGDQARLILERAGDAPVFSLNPLRYHTPTRQLHADVSGSQDALETFFAVWRFQSGRPSGDALPRLLDYLSSLAGAPVAHLSAMSRTDPDVLLLLLRYANEVVGHIELGDHLPATLPQPSELLIECFCRESAYQCRSGRQAVTIDGAERVYRDWSPAPEDEMAGAFVDALFGRATNLRRGADDLAILALCEEVRGAASEGRVVTPRPATNGKG